MELSKTLKVTVACAVGLLVSTGYLFKVGRMRDQVSGLERSAEVLAAARPLAVGEKLSMDAIDGRRLPQAFVPKRALLPRDRTLVLDQVLIHPVPAGETLLWSDLADGPRRRRPTESVPEGLRSFCLPADEIHTQSHLLTPGDTVDILWTHLPEGSASPRTDVVSRRVQVLAVGGAPSPEAAMDLREVPSSMTLLVTPELGVQLATCLVSGEVSFLGRGRNAVDDASPRAAGGEPVGAEGGR